MDPQFPNHSSQPLMGLTDSDMSIDVVNHPHQPLMSSSPGCTLPSNLSVSLSMEEETSSSKSKKHQSGISQNPINSSSLMTMKAQLEKIAQHERAGEPIPENLQIAAQKKQQRRQYKAEWQAGYRARRKQEKNNAAQSSPASGSNNMVEEIDLLKTQLASADQRAVTQREEYEKEINEVKSQLVASNQQVINERQEREKLKSQFDALTQQFTISQRRAKEDLATTKVCLKRYKEEAKTLGLELESTKQELKKIGSALTFDDIKCSICHEIMWQPAILTCGHSFCAQCLYNWFTEDRHKCPVCRQTTQVPRDNQSLRSIIEKFVFSRNRSVPPDRFDFTEFYPKFDTIFVRHRYRHR